MTLDGHPISAHRWDEFAREAERDQGALTTRFEHDPSGHLSAQSVRRGEATVIERGYVRDRGGRLACLHDARQGDTRYVYDPAGQLIGAEGATLERFVHDPAGNLLDEGAARVEGDRLIMQGDRHFLYDAAGNLVEERRGTGGRLVTRHEYDGSHRLVASHTPSGTTRYRYDALGRRISKVGPRGGTRFFWDGSTLLGEEGDRATRWYVHEPRSFRPLACIERAQSALRLAAGRGESAPARAPEVYHYHLDHLGTPREMTDASGRIVWSARYRAFGALALADVAEIDNPLRFQGQYHDVETGLHYNLHRYYDPTSGRFVSQDPIGLNGGENAYRYVADPVQWIDPLGLASCKESLASIDRQLAEGKRAQVSVENRAQAEEILRAYTTRDDLPAAYRNTTDQTLPEGKISDGASDWLPGGRGAYDRKGTYHWDAADPNAAAGDHALIGDHLQIHNFEGKIIRVFY